jgi:hypothetical protein
MNDIKDHRRKRRSFVLQETADTLESIARRCQQIQPYATLGRRGGYARAMFSGQSDTGTELLRGDNLCIMIRVETLG